MKGWRTDMATQKLNLTRDQLATFLKNHELVKQFERLFQVADEVAPNTDTQGAAIVAENAQASANEALAQLVVLTRDAAIDSAAANQKAVQALDALGRIANALELLATAPAVQHNNSLSVDYIDISTEAPEADFKVGRIWWNQSGTLNIGMGNGNITQQVGEEFFAYGKATSAISEGQLVMVTGALGASGVITFAPTSIGLTDPNAILGIATENIALNEFGRVTTMGVVRGIDTTGSSVGETWADGDVLWYNPSVVGGMTKTKPSAPNLKTQVAIIINAGSGGSGSLQVEILHSSTLGGTDSNVQFTALANGQLIQYDSAAGYWKNVAVSLIAEPPIAAGTTAQYWRGDKTWQTLNKASVGLGNVDNTSDLSKPISTATQTALNGKEPTVAAGTTADYYRGDKVWATLATDVRLILLTGLSTATNAVITAADTILSAFGKLQAQLNALGTASLRNAIGLGDLYSRGGILGTVSQSGGTPTGAIIERGSNANGEYVKFADGTQICTFNYNAGSQAINSAFLGGFRTGGLTWTYPVTFAATPVLSIQANDASAFGSSISTAGTSNVLFFLTAVVSQTAATRTCHMTAVGRWF